MAKEYDYIIIGAGIMGLTIAHTLKKRRPNCSLLIIDKEKKEAAHASSRNSGVLHAGFYYTADSFKAKFTAEGNRAMKEYCQSKEIPVNACGKLVVAQNEDELPMLAELEKRGRKNGVNVEIIEESKAKEIEPNIKTYKKALYSPDTASINPHEVCAAIKNDLINEAVEFSLNTQYKSRQKNIINTNNGEFAAKKIINCAGLFSDKIAKDFGFGQNFTIIPFKGLYLKYTKNRTDINTNIYPLPNLKNPFLGVHFTKTVTGEIKIGPTAIPALWRENYAGFENFQLTELLEITFQEAKLFCTNAFGFRDLAFAEMKKYSKNYLIKLAQNMVKHIDPKGFTEFTPPGLRAQLMDKGSLKLVQDFIVEGDKQSIHVLNAVSPAFTCAFPLAEYIASNSC